MFQLFCEGVLVVGTLWEAADDEKCPEKENTTATQTSNFEMQEKQEQRHCKKRLDGCGCSAGG